MKPNKFCQVSPVIVSGDVFGEVLLRFGDFMKLLFRMFLLVKIVIRLLSRGSALLDDRGHDPKKRTSSPTPGCQQRKLKIRSRAAVTGVVMAADVSPPPADAALPVRLQVRPQDVDRGDG